MMRKILKTGVFLIAVIAIVFFIKIYRGNEKNELIIKKDRLKKDSSNITVKRSDDSVRIKTLLQMQE